LQDPKGGRKLINDKAETIARLLMFRDAHAHQRWTLSMDRFLEWKAKQPFDIAMKNGLTFGIAGLWKNTLRH
jgi:putative SOS response-associated peptidase YedK